MAADAGMSRRTFTRLFRAQTGASFAAWRQQGLQAAIARLTQGQSVTRVALDLGYASPSAFASAFRRVLGATPSAYLDIGWRSVHPDRVPRHVVPLAHLRQRRTSGSSPSLRIGLGISSTSNERSRWRRAGSAIGTAAISFFVYGCCGFSKIARRGRSRRSGPGTSPPRDG